MKNRSPLLWPVLALVLLNIGMFLVLPSPTREAEPPIIKAFSSRFEFDRSPGYDVAYPNQDWYSPEWWGAHSVVWSKSADATILFPGLKYEGSYRLEVAVRSAIEPSFLDRLRISINGRELPLELTVGEPVSLYRATVPLDWISSEQNNRLTLHTPPPQQPPNSPDTRLLGVAVDWAELRPDTERAFNLTQLSTGMGWSKPQADSLHRTYRRLAPEGGRLEVSLPKVETKLRFGVLVAEHPYLPLYLPSPLFGPSEPALELRVNDQVVSLTQESDGYEMVFQGTIPAESISSDLTTLLLLPVGSTARMDPGVAVAWFWFSPTVP